MVKLLTNTVYISIIAGCLAIFFFVLLLCKEEKLYNGPKLKEGQKRKSLILIILSVIIPGLLISSPMLIQNNVMHEYASEAEWITVYENNSDTDVVVYVDKQIQSHVPISLPLKAGKDLTNVFEPFLRLKQHQLGRLKIVAKDKTETKTISIDKYNILSNKTITKNSKITKVEYRPVTGKKIRFIGYQSESLQPDVNGQVRITIED